MVDLSRYTGVEQFGRAWQYVLEHDTHAPGSVDRVLLARMVRICDDTVSYLYHDHTPLALQSLDRTPLELRRCAEQSTAGCRSDEDRVQAIARFAAALGEGVDWTDLAAMAVGGTEEQIIARGSDWCADVARVACVLCQLSSVPARLVYLFNTADAYCGHVMIEAWREGTWGAVDSSTQVVYRHPDGRPARTWDLMNDPELVEAHRRPGATYTKVDQFRGAAISNYFVWERDQYDYTTSGVNDYYRSILEMADKGWPDGLKWLYGEDEY